MKNVVMYDADDHALITFGGTSGTKLTNLKQGTISKTSSDAVTGAQLWSTQQTISGLSKDIAANTAKIKTMNENVGAMQETVGSTTDVVNALNDTKADTGLSNISSTGVKKIQDIVKDLLTQDVETSASINMTSIAPASLEMDTPTVVAETNNTVSYDDSTHTSITLDGKSEEGIGAYINNVLDGEISNGSTQAVNGKQLYELKTEVESYQELITKNQTNISKALTNTNNNTTKLITMGADVSTIKDQMASGIVVSIDGQSINNNITATNRVLDFVSGDHITLSNDNGQIEVSVDADGKVAANNNGLVTGNAVYEAIKNIPTSAALEGKADINLGNIDDAGKKVIKDAAKDAVQVAAGTNVTVNENVDATTGNKTYTVNATANGSIAKGNQEAISGDTAFNYINKALENVTIDTSNLADTDLSNISDAGKEKIKDVMKDDMDKKADKTYVEEQLNTKANADGSNIDADKFSEKVAVGTVADGDNRAVSGSAVHQAIAEATETLKENSVNKDLSNISEKGTQKITEIAQNSIKVVAGENTTVTEGTQDGAKTYAVNVSTDAIKNAVKEDLDKKADTTYVNEKLDKKANVDASNLSDSDVKAWTEKLGTGEISKDSTGLVTGNAVFEAISKIDGGNGLVSSDGKTLSVGAEDTSTSVDFKNKDGETRIITGIKTDAEDITSAANVGYVQETAESIYNNVGNAMNNMYRNLNTSINRGVAGASALAALHPLDFDPDDKVNFAVGYGHYHDANAAAIGAFYRPNANTMVNFGITVGNGDPAINAGVSFKLGRGSAYNGVTKAQMVSTINNQANEIRTIKAADADKDERINTLEQENKEMKEQIAQIMEQLKKK